jgi:hypothetical protein
MAAIVFVVVAILGLFAALRPRAFAQYCLVRWQRERLAGNMGALSRTGWIIFGCSAFILIALLLANVQRR